MSYSGEGPATIDPRYPAKVATTALKGLSLLQHTRDRLDKARGELGEAAGNLRRLADKAFGAVPESDSASRVQPGSGYGGEAGEMQDALSALECALGELHEQVRRYAPPLD